MIQDADLSCLVASNFIEIFHCLHEHLYYIIVIITVSSSLPLLTGIALLLDMLPLRSGFVEEKVASNLCD